MSKHTEVKRLLAHTDACIEKIFNDATKGILPTSDAVGMLKQSSTDLRIGRKRVIAQLANTKQVSAACEIFNLTPGRVSQIKLEMIEKGFIKKNETVKRKFSIDRLSAIEIKELMALKYSAECAFRECADDFVNGILPTALAITFRENSIAVYVYRTPKTNGWFYSDCRNLNHAEQFKSWTRADLNCTSKEFLDRHAARIGLQLETTTAIAEHLFRSLNQ